MARHRKTSPIEDLIDLASALPWWVALCFAALSYYLLHAHAISPIPSHDPLRVSQSMVPMITRGLATAAQFFVPFAFVCGAFLSFFSRERRKKLIKDVAASSKPGKTIEGISWREFEMLVGEAFRRQGFTVTETGGNGPDGGVDLVLHKNQEKHLVQCKQWRSIKVGVTVIREFFGVMTAEGAVGGFVVTSGTFTAEAKSFASGRNIRLVEGAELNRWIAASRSTQSTLPVRTQTQIKPVPVQPVSVPSCPVCRSAMQKRTAKRGVNAGNEFWGCSQYPKCRGVVSI